MTSLLSSIFGEAPQKAETADLFANPVVAPPPPVKAPLSQKKKGQASEEEKQQNNEEQVQDEEMKEPVTEKKESNTEASHHHANNNQDDERTVFVGNLPVGTTRRDLQRYFKDCGKIQSTRIRSVAVDPEQGVKLPPHLAGNQKLVQQVLVNQHKVNTAAKASVQGYVVFAHVEAVEKALQLNNTIVKTKGETQDNETTTTTASARRMRVDRVNKEYDARRSVFIGNLPYQADEESLRACFVEACGWTDTDVEGVRIVRDKETHQCKGFGYLLMADTPMVATALRTMEGVKYMGRPLRVRVCGKRFKTRNNNDDTTTTTATTTSANRPKKEKPVSTTLKQMVTRDKHEQNKRKRGVKKAVATGKSKRAAAEAKTNKRIKKIEKRISKGMGKMRKA